MARTLSPEILAALQARTLRIERLFEGVFTNQTLRLWTGLNTLTHDGKEWLGNGWLQSLSSQKETIETQANGLTITLTGIVEGLIELGLTETSTTGTGKLWIAFFNDSDVLLGTDLRFSGDLDRVEIAESESTCTISLQYESKLRRLENKRELKWSNEYQQIEYPGDRGFEYVTFLQNQRIYWGRPDTTRIRGA